MSSRRYREVTCDVCGKMRTFDIHDRENPWNRRVWARVPDSYNEWFVLSMKELDMCDECLSKSVKLRYDGVKYSID